MESKSPPVQLDDRMTDETKAYVSAYLSQMRPSQIIGMDKKLVTQLKEAQCEKLNTLVNFDHLNIDEIRVDNQTDGHQVQVFKYSPKNASPDCPVTVFFHGGGYCKL